MDIFFDGIWRMDWGLGNPNKTAAMVAMLMIAVWPIAALRKGGYWVALAIFFLLGGCLVHTLSRGGVLAALVGLVPVTFQFIPTLSRTRKVAVGAVLLGLIVFGISLKAHKRFTQGIQQVDFSIENRIEIWKRTPRMMVDAPGGWGLGASGDAYMQWYQPVDQGEGYRSLVNSHLTWLVEFGWFFRCLYIAGWLTVLVVCWPRPRDIVTACAFGIWLSFGVSAFFSSVAESWILWVLPFLALVTTLARRTKTGVWPSRRLWMFPTATSVLICAVLWVWGNAQTSQWPVHKSESAIEVGIGKSNVGIVVDQSVMGKTYGKAWRRQIGHPSSAVVFVLTPIDLPRQLSMVVAAGERQSREIEALRNWVAEGRRLLLLNPKFSPEDLRIHDKATKPAVVFGSFVAGDFQRKWDAILQVREVPGSTYLPEWPHYLEELSGDRLGDDSISVQ